MAKDTDLYYTDTHFLRTWEAGIQKTCTESTNILNQYEAITGFKIDTIQNFLLMVNDPQDYYRQQFIEKNKKQLEAFIALKGLNISHNIDLPLGFDVFSNKVNRYKRDRYLADEKVFVLTNGKIIPSPTATERRDSKAHFYARTADQRKRLSIALEMINAFQKVEDELKRELKPSQFDPIFKSKPHCRPLPFMCRLVPDGDGNLMLSPNPQFVTHGFRGTSHLGFNYLTDEQRQRALKDATAIERQRSRPAPSETIIGNSPNFTPSAEAYNIIDTPW